MKSKWKSIDEEIQAANSGNLLAYTSLAIRYYEGDGVEQDYKKARAMFGDIAALIQNYPLVFHLKDVDQEYNPYVGGDGNPQTFWCIRVANAYLGDIYGNGDGVEVDFAKALEYYTTAARMGEGSCAYTVGIMYRDGKGTTHNMQKAKDWLEKAAKMGDSRAQSALWEIQGNKHSIDFSSLEALSKEEIKAKANGGEALAQTYMGQLYSGLQFQGRADEQYFQEDMQKAAYWYEKAVKQGISLAAVNLGCQYMNGWGVTKNMERAIELFLQAAQDQPMACFYLGCAYENGDGVRKDISTSIRYFKRASDSGVVQAKQALENIANRELNDTDNGNAGCLPFFMGLIVCIGLLAFI